MKIPKKPNRGKRSPFYWWRRWKSHQYLPIRKGLLARIQNGDFEYSELFDWAKYEIHYKQDELDEFIKNYKGNDDPKTDELYKDIERRYQKRYNKLYEDAHEVENRRLEGLAEALGKEFKISKKKIKTIMETFGGATEELYIYVDKNKYII
tara:strand:- start:12 stop:464 length:453 start_codon:yes stop_codon:yes gene_type:complete